MINMISFNGFDKPEMQNNSPDAAETEAAFDEFSALLAAFVPAPRSVETPTTVESPITVETAVLPVRQKENELPEYSQPPAANENFLETNNQTVKSENPTEQSVIQTNTTRKTLVDVHVPENLPAPKEIIKVRENLLVQQNRIEQDSLFETPEEISKIGASKIPFQTENRQQNQLDKILQTPQFAENQTTKFAEKQPAKLIFPVQPDEPIKDVQSAPNEIFRTDDFPVDDFPVSDDKNKVIVRQYSQEFPSPVDSPELEIETNTDRKDNFKIHPQIPTETINFTPQNKFVFYLSQLFRDVSAMLKFTENKPATPKITEIESRLEQPDNPTFESTTKSLKPIEQTISEPAPHLIPKIEPKLDLSPKVEADSALPAETPKQIENIESLPTIERETITEVVKSHSAQNLLRTDKSENKTMPESARENVMTKVSEPLLTAGEKSKTPLKQMLATAASEKIFEQISSRLPGEISVFVAAPEKTNILKMRLHPAELGTIEVRLEKMETGEIHVHLQTESDAAREILTAGLEQLRESLQTGGWHVEHLEISSGLPSSAGSENRENSSRQSEPIEKSLVQTNDLEDVSENTDDSTPNRLVNLRA